MSEEDILARIPERWGKYLSIDEGWYGIVFELDKQLAALDPDYTIAQVKEKFGGLRYYLEDIKPEARDRAYKLIEEAEAKASRTCEICGQPGTLNTKKMWYRTLCQEHTP